MAFIITAKAQSITGIYPNGTNLFQPSSTLSFTANSPAGVTNVTVALTVTSVYKGTSFIKSLTAANGLTITGPNTALNVSAVLTSNTLYSAVIQIKDANGAVVNQTVAFDTIDFPYTWEAEDWDYTSAEGNPNLFIDNPQTNAYAGRATTVESGGASNGPQQYRPGGQTTPPALSTETVGDPETTRLRLQYIGTGMTDYDVGWTDGGEFANYTRTYPAGTYNLFVRAAGGNGARTEAGNISVVSGATTMSGGSPYKYGIKGTGWQNYDFMPVTDSAGDLVQITFDGNPATLQMLQVQANDNINFFMLLPLNTNEVATTVALTNVYPDGAFQFQATNQLSFNAISSVNIDPANDISVLLAYTNLFGQGSVTNLTTANGLMVTGHTTNKNVTAPLTSNMVYTAVIQVNDANGIPANLTVSFDTINPAYTFEIEDWNYNGGQFIDNPQTNAYGSPNPPLDGVLGVDYQRTGSIGGAYVRFGLQTEGTSDKARVSHVGFQDYNVGFTTSGNWANYTRTYPAGIYNIFVRVARGDGGTIADAGKVSLVTSDVTQPGQTIQDLGNHSTPSTGGWQSYRWTPVLKAGFPARFVADGSIKTLRYTFTGAGENLGFVMLLPADTSVNPPPAVDSFQPDNSSLFQPTNQLNFVVSSSVGIAQSGVVLNLNGETVSGLTFSGSSTLWNVSYPVKTNQQYVAIITLTDAAGTTVVTNRFATFDASNYQWEAEDYNYGGGQYFDNQINAYADLASVADVDNHQSNLGANPHLYRPNSVEAPVPSTQTGDIGGELPRTLFTSGGGGGTDYCIGFFGNGSWVNYTRQFPAGTYTIVGRFAEGQNLTQPTMSLVTGDPTTTSQIATLLGSFDALPYGWATWQWATLKDSNGKPVKITLNGSATTLRYAGSTIAGQPELNTGFFMLAPTIPDVVLTATVSGGNIVISFMTQNGSSFQVQYKNSLTDANWIPLGSAISGNGAVQFTSDPAAGASRFYRVQVQ